MPLCLALKNILSATTLAGLGLALMIFTGAAEARAGITGSDEPLYTVSNIKVDKTASSASVARERALSTAQQKAFATVLKRISLPADAESLAAPTATELLAMVQSMGMADEKTSSVRYMADFTITLKPEAVKAFLEAGGVPYINSVSAPFVIVPIYENASGKHILGEDNPWFTFFKNYQYEAPIVPLITPYGDAMDTEEITTLLSSPSDEAAYQSFLSRYDAEGIILAEAKVDHSQKAIIFTASKMRPTADTKPLRFSVSTSVGEDKAFAAAVGAIMNRLADEYKQKNVLQFSQGSYLTAVVPIKNLGEWLKIERRLASIPVIEKYELQAMKADKVQIIIYFGIGLERLLSDIAAAGMELAEAEEGDVWLLSLASSKANAPATTAPEVTVRHLPDMQN